MLNEVKSAFGGRKGFTLIELLIVIFIISILIVTTVVYLNYARQDARDSRRKHDLDQIKSALELYFGQNEKYPWGRGSSAAPDIGSNMTDWSSSSNSLVSALAPYLSPLSKDPYNKTVGSITYVYWYLAEYFAGSEQSGFILATRLENPNTADVNYRIWPASSQLYNYVLRGGTCSQGTCAILSL